ncbi:MAG: hypothetical protein PHG23_00070 [Candidatus Pacebacteria bacterium]|nr:hypothetical protein [Candidatus Paceibacterota bacterium]
MNQIKRSLFDEKASQADSLARFVPLVVDVFKCQTNTIYASLAANACADDFFCTFCSWYNNSSCGFKFERLLVIIIKLYTINVNNLIHRQLTALTAAHQ